MKIEKDKEEIKFKCLKCGIEEEIPRDVVEFFHEVYNWRRHLVHFKRVNLLKCQDCVIALFYWGILSSNKL